MKIAVLIKPIPEVFGEVEFSAEDGTMARRKASHTLEGPDCDALNRALEYKLQGRASHVSVFSMTPETNGRLLLDLKKHGVDAIYHLCDPAFAGSDSLCTARIIAASLRSRGTYELVLAGRRSLDSETGQVPAVIAYFLDAPFVSNVVEMTPAGASIRVCRQLEDRMETLVVPLPCVLSICGARSVLNPPSLATLRRARDAIYSKITHDDIPVDLAEVGGNGSPTRVVKLCRMGLRERCAVRITYPTLGARAIMEELGCAKAAGRSQVRAQSEGAPFPASSVNMVVYPPPDDAGFENALELTAFLARRKGNPVAVALGRTPDRECAARMRQAGAARCVVVQTEDTPDDSVYAKAAAEAVRAADTVLFPSSVRMRAIAPFCAAILGAGLTADCTDLACDEDGALVQIRPTFGGTLLAHIKTKRRPVMATVRAGVFEDRPEPVPPGNEWTPERREWNETGRITRLSRRSLKRESHAAADVIFSVGAGLSVEQAKRVFSWGFAQGASRAAVNGNLAPYSCQVGQTGRTVRPKLYVAFGISGAVQHLAGMKDAARLVAVNPDRRAPIFDYCDVAICAKADEIIGELEKMLREAGMI